MPTFHSLHPAQVSVQKHGQKTEQIYFGLAEFIDILKSPFESHTIYGNSIILLVIHF